MMQATTSPSTPRRVNLAAIFAASTGATALSIPATTSTTTIAAVSLASVAVSTITLPTSNLYTLHTQPSQKYLIETDKRFTDYKTYTGSDYLLSRLTLDPTLAQKRLGDGFYEQKLISDQITELTGRRFIGKYSSTEDQTKALMDAALTTAKQLDISTGIALSKTQAAALTSDIVWMVEENITLADGSTTTALVPRVYLSAQHATELKPDGALIAADTIDINTTGAVNNAGTIRSTTSSMIAARDIFNTGGSLSSGGDMLLKASRDITNSSGSISGRRVALSAGRDVLNTTATHSIGSPVAFNTFVGTAGSITATDSLTMEALNNITIMGSTIKSGGDVQLKAGNELTVGAIATTSGTDVGGVGYRYANDQTMQLTSGLLIGGSLSMRSGADMTLTAANLEVGKSASLISGSNLTFNTVKNITSHDHTSGPSIDRAYDETVLGTSLKAGGNITLAAINVNLMSASITSDTGLLNIIADNNISIGTTDEKHTSFVQSHSESSSFFSSSSTDSRSASSASYAIGSSLSGDSVNIQAGSNKRGDPSTALRTGDINIVGSSIAGTNDVTLDAGNNLSILAATSTNSSSNYTHTSENGLMSNGGMSFTYGSRDTTDQSDSRNTLQSQNRSMVGSTNGNLTLKAGGKALISGSDIIAAQDINLLARDITINSGLDMSNSTQSHDSKQSGLTVAVSVGAVNAAQTVQQMKQLGGQVKDKRTQALALATSALAVSNAMSGGLTNASVSATYGSSESHSDSTQTSSKSSGSTLKAGGNLNLSATGGGTNSNITIQGSDIKAGNNISLAADNDINLLADQSTANQTSHNSSSSSGVGVAASTGQGFGVTANAASGRGNADGNDVTYTNSHLDAGNTLHIKSGGDTNIKGATANGKQVVADIGGNLNIESLQDTSTYTSKQESASASVTVGITNSGAVSGQVSASQSKINGTYASVKEQSGLKAGDGGFQVNVKGNTALKGGVIESSDKAIQDGSNTFSTATLTTSDIQNKSEYDAQSISVSAGSSGVTPPIALNAGDKNDSTTKSGISGASIKITDEAKQKQLTGKDSSETIASLNRDVKTGKDTSGAISNNLDVNEVQTAMTVTQAFTQQAGTFVASQAQKSDKLKAEGEAKQKLADKETDPTRKQQLQSEADNLKQQSADTKDESKLWQPGGTYRQIATALTAAAGGNVTGGTAQLVQGAAVNYLQSLGATEVKKIADTFKDKNGNNTPESESVRAALHGLLACAGAGAQGGDCGSAALGASAGSVINTIMAGDPKSMTAAEKENRKNLVATLVTGIAATTGAGNIAAATSSAVIETENNFLSPELSVIRKKAEAALAANPKDEKARKVKDSLDNLDNASKQQVDELLARGKAGEPGAYDAAQKIITARNVEAATQLNNCIPPFDCAAAYKPSSKENALAAVQLPGWGSGEATPTADPVTAVVLLKVGMKTPLVSAFGAAGGAAGEAGNQWISNDKVDNYEKIAYNAMAGWATGPIASNLKGAMQFATLSGTTGAAVTAYNNSQQGSNDSVLASFGFSAVGGGAGAKFGNWSSQSSSRIFTSTIPSQNYNPNLGVLLTGPSTVKVPNQSAAAIANEFGSATFQAGAAALTPNVSNSTLP